MINGLGLDHLDQLIPSQIRHASSYNLRNDHLDQLIPLKSHVSSYNLRNSEDYLTIRTYTQLYYNSFLPSVVREWNSLPDSSRNACTLESFKMSLNMDTVNKPPYYYIGER